MGDFMDDDLDGFYGIDLSEIAEFQEVRRVLMCRVSATASAAESATRLSKRMDL